MTLAARAMSANDQEATPGTSVNGGMPVMAELTAPGAPGQGVLPGAVQPQMPMATPAYPGFGADLFRRKGLR
jgi:hypothetical protein